jgi:hypothetical protein
MTVVTVSLWLPIGRSNFFNRVADLELLGNRIDERVRRCEALDPDPVPQLQVSVMRRVLEVLPRAFGYDAAGTCRISTDDDDVSRPVQVVLTLSPATAVTPAPAPDDPQAAHGARAANVGLVEAGVDRVSLRVDENGNYTFAADVSEVGPDTRDARAALLAHAREVFGGGFVVERLEEHWGRTHVEGTSAIRRYNGLHESTQEIVTAPRGVLNFFQLNVVVEGLCNESLLPAVFFEHNDFVTQWNADPRGSTPVLRTIGQLIDALATTADASSLPGQIIVLRRFLAVTARESLQRLKWAVESVRRSLLDLMMGVLHRRTRFIQLNLGATDVLRTPELAEQATETQLRGYVMLVGAKLPLVTNLGDLAGLAIEQIREQVDDDLSRALVHELVLQQHNWQVLLSGLRTNVQGLDSAITHEWREKLLYEQEQTRSEQEAMAEIERSRRGRLASKRFGETAYNALMLIFTVLAVFYAIKSTGTTPSTSESWLRLITDAWPIVLPLIAAAVFFYLVVPSIVALRRVLKERRGDSETYGYELAFRLDEDTSMQKIDEWLSRTKVQHIRGTPFRGMRLVGRGSSRIERVSPDTTLMKMHSVITFRVSVLRYARFEIVNEIVVRRVANNMQYFLRKSRIFGDSPRMLSHDRVLRLAGIILTHAAAPLAIDTNGLKPADVLDLAQTKKAPGPGSGAGPAATDRGDRTPTG